MPAFTDNQRRTWHLTVDVNAARQVRKLCGVNILDTQQGLPQLAADPILLVDCLYALCAAQCDQQGVTPEDFGRGLVGEAIDQAGDALIAALLDFFPPRKRKLLEQMLEASRTLEQTLAGLAAQKLPAAIEALRRLVPGALSPDTPASSDSTPDPLPSAS